MQYAILQHISSHLQFHSTLFIVPSHLLFIVPSHLLFIVPSHLLFIVPSHLLFIVPSHLLFIVPYHLLFIVPSHLLFIVPYHLLFIVPSHLLAHAHLLHIQFSFIFRMKTKEMTTGKMAATYCGRGQEGGGWHLWCEKSWPQYWWVDLP